MDWACFSSGEASPFELSGTSRDESFMMGSNFLSGHNSSVFFGGGLCSSIMSRRHAVAVLFGSGFGCHTPPPYTQSPSHQEHLERAQCSTHPNFTVSICLVFCCPRLPQNFITNETRPFERVQQQLWTAHSPDRSPALEFSLLPELAFALNPPQGVQWQLQGRGLEELLCDG